MDTIAIIQARMNSSRLPNKTLFELAGKPMLLNIVERVSRARLLDKVVVATSDCASDDPIEELLYKHNHDCFRGDLNNVLKRFYYCAKFYNSKTIVRLTADNALVDPQIIDEAVGRFGVGDVDYLYYKNSLPIGMCVEVFAFEALEKAYYEAIDDECLEHVTPYIRKNPQLFNVLNYINPFDRDHSSLRFTMDTIEDYHFVKKIYDWFGTNDFSYEDILETLTINKEWMCLNDGVRQNKVLYSGITNEGKD